MKPITITLPLLLSSALMLLPLSHLPAQSPAAAQASAHSPDVPQTSLAQAQLKQWRGQYGGETKPASQVITTQKAWVELWKKMGAAAPADLNEKTDVAIFISIGERPTGGYKPYIISAVEKDGKMVVSYSSGQPILTDVVMQEVTHPWTAAILPKTALPIVFKVP